MKKKKYSDFEKDSILAEVASLYYEHDMSGEEIAKRMFFSKSKVSRLLKNAKDKKIVKIVINFPLERMGFLEEELESTFGLQKSIVIRSFPEQNDLEIKLQQIGKIAASYLDDLLKDGDSIGISWGRTLFHVAEECKPKYHKDIRVVQVLGAGSEEYDHRMDSPNLVRSIAEKYNGTCSMIYAPLYVENNVVLKALKNEAIISKALKQAENVDYLITGIADFTNEAPSISWAGYLNAEEKERLLRKGTVGYVCGHFIDKNGHAIVDDVENNVVGITISQLHKIKNVIAISGGVDKTRATFAVLNGKLINTLITDDKTAIKLLAMNKKQRRSI